ncbi:MAG: hypothetical protein ACK4Z9_06355 [Thermodesulfovibrionales bacterium]
MWLPKINGQGQALPLHMNKQYLASLLRKGGKVVVAFTRLNHEILFNHPELKGYMSGV